MDSGMSMKRKLDLIDPLLKHKIDGMGIDKCLAAYMMQEWRDRISDEYMTMESLNTIFDA